MRMRIFLSLLMLCAWSACAQDAWRIGWKQDGLTWYGKSFTATPDEAEQKLSAANSMDPAVHRFLAADTRKLPPYGTPLEQMPTPRARRLYVASLLFAAGANAMDVASSYGKHELNPLLQGSGGTFDASSALRKAALVSALEIPQAFLVHKTSRQMKMFTIANFAAGAVLMGVSFHNFGVPAAHR